MKDISYEARAGSLIGLALGDAMGKHTEFMRYDKIMKAVRQTGGAQKVMFPHKGLVTDDTHMTLYTARAVMQANGGKPSTWARELRRAYVAWYRDPDGAGRAPGGSCMTSGRALANKDNKYWTRVVTLSKGCGANMRIAPIALMQNRDQITGAAQLSAAMTHGHPTAIVATELTAWAIRMAAEGMNPYDVLDWLINYAHDRMRDGNSYEGAWLNELRQRRWGKQHLSMEQGWKDNLTMLYRAWNKLQADDNGISDACEGIGQAWNADSALGVAMFVAARHYKEPVYALARGARTNGDSDSIACIAGAIIGAYAGLGAWPQSWTDRVEFGNELQNLAVFL